MRPSEAAELAKKEVAPPWDELRAARVQRLVVTELSVDKRKARRVGATRLRRPLAWLAAAVALVGLFVVLLVARKHDGAGISRLELADGSLALFDESARVVPELVSDTRVELRQFAGSASYDVTPRPTRTFVVRVDDVRVEVLGTAFRVEKDEANIRVVVTRGRVRVTRGARTVELTAGEQVTLTEDKPVAAAEAELPPADATTTGVQTTPSATPSAVASAEPLPSAEAPAPTEGAAELFRRADEARAAGNQAEALKLLRLLVKTHPQNGRVTLASFTIGRIEAQRGNFEAAAAAFESCGSAMSGEALAEAALARSAGGQSAQAKALADQYLKRFPNGARAPEMEKLSG